MTTFGARTRMAEQAEASTPSSVTVDLISQDAVYRVSDFPSGTPVLEASGKLQPDEPDAHGAGDAGGVEALDVGGGGGTVVLGGAVEVGAGDRVGGELVAVADGAGLIDPIGPAPGLGTNSTSA
jgi:hypothetical protein